MQLKRHYSLLALSLLCLPAVILPMKQASAQTIIKKSNPQSRGVIFLMVDSASSTSAGKTGLTGQAQGTAVNVVAGAAGTFTKIAYTPLVSGGTETSCAGTITDFGDGYYLYVPTTGESNTNYDQLFKAKATGAIDYASQAAFWTYKLDDVGTALLPTSGVIAAGSAGTALNTTLTAPNVNSYKGQVAVFSSGALVGQTHLVASNTTGANSVLTVLTAPASSPAAGDTFYLVTGLGQKAVDLLTGAYGVALASGQNVATVNGLAPPTRWNLQAIDASGFVTYNNAAPPTVSQIAGGILATPSQPIATNNVGYVTSTNAGTGLTTQQQNQLAAAAGYTFPTNFGLLSINGSGYVTSTNAGAGLTTQQATQLLAASTAQQAGSPVVLPSTVVPTADINSIIAAWQAAPVDGTLTQKQLNTINAATALESDRTWNATTHTAVVTWYRRQSGSTAPDKTRPVKILTTVYDSTNVQIVSQTTSLNNLP